MGKHAVNVVPLIDKASPMGVTTLIVAQPVVIKPISKSGMIFVAAHILKEERKQNVVDLLSRGFDGIAEILPVHRDDQINTDSQSNGKVDRDKSICVVLEAIWQQSRVRQTDLPLVGAVQIDFTCVQLKACELVVFADRVVSSQVK